MNWIAVSHASPSWTKKQCKWCRCSMEEPGWTCSNLSYCYAYTSGMSIKLSLGQWSCRLSSNGDRVDEEGPGPNVQVPVLWQSPHAAEVHTMNDTPQWNVVDASSFGLRKIQSTSALSSAQVNKFKTQNNIESNRNKSVDIFNMMHMKSSKNNRRKYVCGKTLIFQREAKTPDAGSNGPWQSKFYVTAESPSPKCN